MGLVNAGLWLPPETILAQMGETAGRRLIDALAVAPDRVFEIIAREGISCEATRTGTLHLAHGPGGLKDLQDRHRQGNAFGASLQLLDAAETRRRTGSDAFHGALWTPSAGTVQPLAYCHGLARAARRAGARVHTASPVTAIERRKQGWLLRAGSGSVRAGALLLATNAYPQAAARPRSPQFVAVNFCQFATAPLPGDVLDSILPGREGCWDTALVMSSLRRDAAGRLIVGGMGNSTGQGGRIHADWARRKLRTLYPTLAALPFEHHWSGRIAMTRDHIPKVLDIGPSAYSVFGYSGRGIAPGTVLGTAAARALLRGTPEELPLPVVPAYSERLAPLREAYYEFGATLTHAIKARGPVAVG